MRWIRASTKRAILRQLVELTAIPAQQTVREALLNLQAGIYSPSFRQGRVLASTSGYGQSASFEDPFGGREYTQENVFALSEEFFDIYEDALDNNALLQDTGEEANSRAIFNAMMADDRLQPVTRRATDFTLLNFPQTGNVAPL